MPVAGDDGIEAVISGSQVEEPVGHSGRRETGIVVEHVRRLDGRIHVG
jgi:hypothetical protein